MRGPYMRALVFGPGLSRMPAVNLGEAPLHALG